MTAATEILLVDGGRCRVRGDAKAVEHSILSAARGAIMEFAWLTDLESGEQLGINPEHVVLLRTISA